jgi:hypothetical protein
VQWSQQYGFFKRNEDFVVVRCCSPSLTGINGTSALPATLRKPTFGKGSKQVVNPD